MKIKISNVGPIKQGEVNLNDNLLVLCGANNTGKTYLAYTIYGMFQTTSGLSFPLFPYLESQLRELASKGTAEINFIKLLEENIGTICNRLENNTRKSLSNIFAVSEDNTLFLDSKITITELITQLYLEKIEHIAIQKNIKYPGVSVELSKQSGSGTLWISSNIVIDNLQDPNNRLESAHKIQQTIWTLGSYIFSYISDILFPKVYIAPAERSSINLFSKELSIKRNSLIDGLLDNTDDKETIDVLRRKASRYAWPIRDSLRIAEDLSNIQKTNSEFKYLAEILEKDILHGKIKISKEGEMSFSPAQSDLNLGIHMTASLVKSLASLSFYFRHMARTNDFIIIDEPELNLHPDNQRKIARFLVRVVNAGFKVMISTHSDYIIRELNNLMMLRNPSPKASKLVKEFGFNKEELLDYTKVGAYMVGTNGIVNSLPVTNTGFEVDSIDQEINNLNEIAEKIYFTLYDE